MQPTSCRHRFIRSPFGLFALIQTASGEVRTMLTPTPDTPALAESRLDPNLLEKLAGQLRRYFAGEPVDFSEVPLPAGSPFFQRCWDACRSIPRGRTRSYAQLAVAAGSSPGASRAAGQAMRHNPLPVIIPCHRVIAADGRLHGFSGSRDPSGEPLALKAALLRLEGAAVAEASHPPQVEPLLAAVV